MAEAWLQALEREAAEGGSPVATALAAAELTPRAALELATSYELAVTLRPATQRPPEYRIASIDDLVLSRGGHTLAQAITELATEIRLCVPEELAGHSPSGGPPLGLLLKLWLVGQEGQLEEALRSAIDPSAIEDALEFDYDVGRWPEHGFE